MDFDIAGICAHPDDAELVMGGTLALAAARGQRVALVDLTRGESGSRGTPELRAREAAEAARLLGALQRESLGLPDGGLQVVPEHKDAVVAALRRLRPRVVITQHWEQRHPDHAATSRIVQDAAFLAGLRNYRPDLGAAFRPRRLVYAVTLTETQEAPPTFVVDVSAVWATKMSAVAAYVSQFVPRPGDPASPLDRYRETIELAARRHGERVGVHFGEGFVTREPLLVDDVAGLAGAPL
jgi:bacillithiol biosynthesis deacetylase BshB1